METGSLAKVVAAFVGGIIVALGGALVYVKVNEAKVNDLPFERAPQIASVRAPQNAAPPAEVKRPEADEKPVVDEKPAVNSMKVKRMEPPSETKPSTASAANPSKGLSASKNAKRKPVSNPLAPAAPAHAAPSQVKSVFLPPVPQPPVLSAENVPAQAPSSEAPSSKAPARGVPPNDVPPPPPAAESASVPPAPNVPPPHVVTLEAGTRLPIRLGETLSTDHNYAGDTFRGTLDSAIVRDGFIIADKGSKILGRVVNAQKAGRVEGVANLQLTLTEINTTDGQRIRVETSLYDQKGATTHGEDTAKIAGGAALGAIIGAIGGGGKGAAIGAGAGGAAGTGAVLLTRGKAAVLPSETRLDFQLARPATITEKVN
jgi:hypothetical protein